MHLSTDMLYAAAGSASLSISSVWIGIGVTIPIVIIVIIVVVIVILVRGFSLIGRRRRAGYPRWTSLINNTTSTDVATATNTQNSAYPSSQAPPQSIAPQPVAAYPTGQHAGPQYPTSSPQQPPASYPTGKLPPGQHLSGGEAPRAYPK